MWPLGTLLCFCRIWACLPSLYAWFLTCFPDSILGIHVLISLRNLFEIYFSPLLHLSSVIDTWNVACMGSFGSYYLCSVLGTWLWSVSDFPSLLEGIRNYKGYRAKILTVDAQVFLQGWGDCFGYRLFDWKWQCEKEIHPVVLYRFTR